MLRCARSPLHAAPSPHPATPAPTLLLPVFFMDKCGMRPMGVSLLGVVGPLGVALASWAAQRASKLVGRVQARTRCAGTSETGLPPAVMCCLVYTLCVAMDSCIRITSSAACRCP